MAVSVRHNAAKKTKPSAFATVEQPKFEPKGKDSIGNTFDWATGGAGGPGPGQGGQPGSTGPAVGDVVGHDPGSTRAFGAIMGLGLTGIPGLALSIASRLAQQVPQNLQMITQVDPIRTEPVVNNETNMFGLVKNPMPVSRVPRFAVPPDDDVSNPSFKGVPPSTPTPGLGVPGVAGVSSTGGVGGATGFADVGIGSTVGDSSGSTGGIGDPGAAPGPSGVGTGPGSSDGVGTSGGHGPGVGSGTAGTGVGPGGVGTSASMGVGVGVGSTDPGDTSTGIGDTSTGVGDTGVGDPGDGTGTGEGTGEGDAGAGEGDAGDGDAGFRFGGQVPDRSNAPDGSEPITAHQGEYVMTPEAVQMYGPWLDIMNSHAMNMGQGSPGPVGSTGVGSPSQLGRPGYGSYDFPKPPAGTRMGVDGFDKMPINSARDNATYSKPGESSKDRAMRVKKMMLEFHND